MLILITMKLIEKHAEILELKKRYIEVLTIKANKEKLGVFELENLTRSTDEYNKLTKEYNKNYKFIRDNFKPLSALNFGKIYKLLFDNNKTYSIDNINISYYNYIVDKIAGQHKNKSYIYSIIKNNINS